MKAASFDVVIVGNGAVGLLVGTALAAQAPDSTVAVIGPATRPGAGSTAAGAMLSCFAEVTRTTRTSPAGIWRFDLQRAAHIRWPTELAVLAEFARAPLVVSSDTFVILNSRGGSSDSANFEAMVRTLDEFAEPYEEVDAVPGLDPLPDSRPLRSLYLPREGAVHSGHLLAAIEARAAHLGVHLIDGTVEKISCASGRVDGVALDDSTSVGAGTVILANGASLTQLVSQLGDRYAVPPVVSGSGVAFVAERVVGNPVESVIRTVTRAGSCGLHVVPQGERREYIGATNVVFGQPELRAHLGVCQFLSTSAIDQVARQLSLSRLDEIRVGNRPLSFDTFPLLGPGPVDGSWIIGGGFRDGLHAAPELAELAARSILGGQNLYPPEFTPCRVPISTMTVEESVDGFVTEQIASAFEGGIHLTPFQGLGDLDRIYRPMAERLYEQLGTSTGLASDLVNFLCLTRKSERDVERAADYLRAVGTP